MPLATNIVLADAQATPVNHTFKPIGYDRNQVFTWEDQSAASTIGNWKITMKYNRPGNAQAGVASNGRNHNVKFALHEPVLETLGTQTISGIPPAPTVSYIPRGFVEIPMPERATLQNRKDLRKMLGALFSDPQVIAVIEGQEQIW